MISTDPKKLGKELGEGLGKMIVGFKWWAPIRNEGTIVFRQVKKLPDDHKGTNQRFFEARTRLQTEQWIIDTYIMPYVAMITAPTRTHKAQVLDDLYLFYQDITEQELTRFNLTTNGVGFTYGITRDKIMSDKAAFDTQMDVISGHVDKAIKQKILN